MTPQCSPCDDLSHIITDKHKHAFLRGGTELGVDVLCLFLQIFFFLLSWWHGRTNIMKIFFFFLSILHIVVHVCFRFVVFLNAPAAKFV